MKPPKTLTDWRNLGREVAAAESAGKDRRVDRLIDVGDEALVALSPSKQRKASAAYLEGRG